MENQLMVSLSKNKLLKNVDISKIDLEAAKGRLMTVGEGEILYREGDFSDSIYLVVSGEINILKKRLLGKTKSFIYSENDFFGHEEFLEETARTSTAIALRDTYLICLLKEEVDNLIRQDGEILLNMREPLSDIDSELGLKKNVEKVEEKPTMPSWEIKSQDEFDKTRATSYDHAETNEFFKSISDTSRVEEEQLIQPLDKAAPIVEETPIEEEPPHEEKFTFNEGIFNEDGIIKSEFEIPDVSVQDELPKVEFNKLDTLSFTKVSDHEEDLNDALFQMLSGTTPPPSEPSPIIEKHEVIPPSKATDEDDQFFAALQIQEPEPVKEEIPKPKIQAPKIEEPVVIEEKPKHAPEVKLPQVPAYSPISKDYDVDDIFAEADAQIKALSKEIPENEPEPIKEAERAAEPEQKIAVNKETKKMSGEELEILIKAAELVNSTIKVDEVLKIIVDVATQFTSADRGTLYLIDRERSEIWSLIVIGNEVKEYRLKLGEGLAGYVAKTGEIVNIKDVQSDPRFNKSYDRASGYVTKNMICFPIKNNKAETIGVLQLINSRNGFFSQHDEEFLQALSIHSAIALQNAEMVEKLLQSERVHSLGKMANFLIQDIKKPVLVSKRYAEHLLNKQLAPETSQIVQMLLEQLTQVADLVQTTSSYSEGKSMLRLNSVSLNNILADYHSRVDTYVVSRSCQVFNEFDKDITVKLDVKEFFQCYMHIIKNACDAMPEGGSIAVSTRREEKKVKIYFKDNGLGIPEGYKDKIFEPFMSYGKKEGTGLGLAITKKIVEAHNGTIEVDSTTGSGATFIISLPIAASY